MYYVKHKQLNPTGWENETLRYCDRRRCKGQLIRVFARYGRNKRLVEEWECISCHYVISPIRRRFKQPWAKTQLSKKRKD
jgi:hypothetical protein